MKHLQKELQTLSEVCEVRAIYSTKIKPSQRPKICSAADASNLLFSFYDALEIIEQKEVFSCIFMTRGSRLLSIAKISEGSATGCVVDIQYILRLAILQNAQAVILCHNHPSGNLVPSDTDKNLTKKCIEALKLLDIQVLDHIILSGEGKEAGFFSFVEDGILF